MPTPRILSVLSLILNLRHLVLSSARGNNIQYLGLRHTARLKHLLELLDENRCHHRTHLDTCSGLDTRDPAAGPTRSQVFAATLVGGDRLDPLHRATANLRHLAGLSVSCKRLF